MIRCKRIGRDEGGTAVIELAVGLPLLLIMLWMIIQLGLVLRAMSGIQHALGEGARYATLCLDPTATGCSLPQNTAIKNKMSAAVYGIQPGTFTIVEPVQGTADGSTYLDLQVDYTQPTDLIMFPGPTISVSRSKRVWVASNGA